VVSRHFDDLDAVLKSDSLDDFRQLIFALQSSPGSGGLMTYGVDVTDLFARSAIYVDRILRGADPGELPIQQPTKYELGLNLKTAKALGLMIPETLLATADEVIQ
jgi:putative ABC transport system substrate-binding protein